MSNAQLSTRATSRGRGSMGLNIGNHELRRAKLAGVERGSSMTIIKDQLRYFLPWLL